MSKELPSCSRFEMFDVDKCETVCDFESMKRNCPLLKAGYRLVPELKVLTRRELGLETGITLGDKVWETIKTVLEAQRDYDQKQLEE